MDNNEGNAGVVPKPRRALRSMVIFRSDGDVGPQTVYSD